MKSHSLVGEVPNTPTNTLDCSLSADRPPSHLLQSAGLCRCNRPETNHISAGTARPPYRANSDRTLAQFMAFHTTISTVSLRYTLCSKTSGTHFCPVSHQLNSTHHPHPAAASSPRSLSRNKKSGPPGTYPPSGMLLPQADQGDAGRQRKTDHLCIRRIIWHLVYSVFRFLPRISRIKCQETTPPRRCLDHKYQISSATACDGRVLRE